MQALNLVIGYVNDVLFVGLAVIGFRQWRAHRDATTAWVAVTFGILATVVIAVVVMPAVAVLTHDVGMLWARKTLIVLLLLFPYALFQFAATFEPHGKIFPRVAAALTLAVVGTTLVLPNLPMVSGARPGWYAPYVAAVLLQWSVLSTTASLRLWRGGQGRPTIPRRRMRVLAAAATALNISVVLAAMFPSRTDINVAEVVAGLLITVSAVLFAVGFALPAVLRVLWRRPEEEALQAAQLRLMAATTADDVRALLLPQATAVLGARAAAQLDEDDNVLGIHGASAEWAHAHLDDPRLVRMPLHRGELVVWTTPTNPYFGREELDLLARLAVIADLALLRGEALQAQQQSTARLEEVQAIAHIGGWQWEMGFGRMTWTAEMARMVGLDGQEPPRGGDAYLQLVHPDDRTRVVDSVRRAMQHGGRFSLDHRVTLPDGTIRTLHAQGRAEADEHGAVRRIVGTAQDVSERKKTEDALADAFKAEQHARMAFERANAELESFVYSVSHDLKSPIISLLGYMDYLQEDFGSQLPAQAVQYLERMTSSASYMQALIQDLLELSRVGRVQTEASTVNLNTVVREIRDELLIAHPKASIDIADLPVVRMNPLRARQLFTNLIGNALVHGGRPDMHVQVDAQVLNGDGALVVVHDDGVGIPQAYRERIFGVFERLELGSSPTVGTGIGLAVCRKVMEHLGGSVSAVDADKGANLQLWFPAQVLVGVSQRAPAWSARG